MNSKILNITNGEYFNRYFQSKFGGVAVPFCEAMMDGDTLSDIYSEAFIRLRARELNVDCETYRSKMQAHDALQDGAYSTLCLWFGKDTFCQLNLLTLLAYLEQIGYKGKVELQYINDETFEIVEQNVEIKLGAYKWIYDTVLIRKQMPSEVGVLDAKAIGLYFDYLSADGLLARLVIENADMDKMALVRLLMENSKAYGLSDLQAEKLIDVYRRG